MSPFTFLLSLCHTEGKHCHCQAVGNPAKLSKRQQQTWREGKPSCFHMLSSRQLLFGKRKEEAILPCWPSVRRTLQQLVCLHADHPLPPDSLWMLSPHAPCHGVKGVGVSEHGADGTSEPAISWKAGSLQQKTTKKRTRAVRKPRSVWSWEGGMENRLIQ